MRNIVVQSLVRHALNENRITIPPGGGPINPTLMNGTFRLEAFGPPGVGVQMGWGVAGRDRKSGVDLGGIRKLKLWANSRSVLRSCRIVCIKSFGLEMLLR